MKSISSGGLAYLLFASIAAAQPGALGAGWQRIGLADIVHSVAIAPDDPETLYAVASDPSTSVSSAYRSTDGGDAWSLLASALPGDTAETIRIDPHDSHRLFTTTLRDLGNDVHATRAYRSMDGGGSWQLIGDFSACGGTYAFDTARPASVYLALGCGNLYASDDGGVTWALRTARTLSHLVSGPHGALYAFDFDEAALVRSSDGGLSWRRLASPPCSLGSLFLGITGLAVDFAGRLFVSTGHVRMIFVDCPGLFRSDDEGRPWTEISATSYDHIVIDTGETSRLYARLFSLGDGDIFASADDGVDWQETLLPAEANDLALSPSGRTLYAATNLGIYRLDVRKTRIVPPR